MHKLSNKVAKIEETNPTKCEEMPKRRRGRPPKSKSTKSVLMQKTNTTTKDLCPSNNKKVGCDVNLRRESYNISMVNDDSKIATFASSPKQLQLGDRRNSYKESLIKFSKDLGPTARKVALRKLQGQGLINYQARYQLGHLVQSSEVQPTPCFLDVNPIFGSVGNTKTNQVSQPLMDFGNSHTDAIANYKGKNVMVNDGSNYRNNWNVGNNLDSLFGKQKTGGIKIGNGLMDNQDGVEKNLSFGQVGNQRTINQVDSFFSSYNENFNQNSSNKILGIEDVSDQNKGFWNVSEVPSRNGKVNSRVYPSIYVPPSRKFSGSLVGFDGTTSSMPWAPLPSVHVPPQVQQLQNWCLPPPETKNSVAMDDFWQDQDMQHALAFNMQMTDQQSDVWYQNMQTSSQPNQFLQPDPQQPQVLMPMPTHMWSQMEMSRANPEQESLSFGTQLDFVYQMGNNLFYQPPGF